MPAAPLDFGVVSMVVRHHQKPENFRELFDQADDERRGLRQRADKIGSSNAAANTPSTQP